MQNQFVCTHLQQTSVICEYKLALLLVRSKSCRFGVKVTSPDVHVEMCVMCWAYMMLHKSLQFEYFLKAGMCAQHKICCRVSLPAAFLVVHLPKSILHLFTVCWFQMKTEYTIYFFAFHIVISLLLSLLFWLLLADEICSRKRGVCATWSL